jgi:hypothetical protein
VDDVEPASPEPGVGSGDPFERALAERVPQRARREDEERRLLEQDDLGVRNQAPDGQGGADASERGAQDDEPAPAGRSAESGDRRAGLSAKAARRGGERGSRQPEESPATEDRTSPAWKGPLSAA